METIPCKFDLCVQRLRTDMKISNNEYNMIILFIIYQATESVSYIMMYCVTIYYTQR